MESGHTAVSWKSYVPLDLAEPRHELLDLVPRRLQPDLGKPGLELVRGQAAVEVLVEQVEAALALLFGQLVLRRAPGPVISQNSVS